MRSGVSYVRNYGTHLDLPWQEVFQTNDRSAVEDYCRGQDIAIEWKPDGTLRTSQTCQAAIAHPITGEMVWFNQAHLFHISNLEPHVRHSLLSELGEEALPRNAYYGDGAPIEDAALGEIRAAYDAEEIVFPWQNGDVLMIDNMLSTHGRRPFSGPRRVIVGMSAHGGVA
jgi:alpha-ketoglutarate-dependent taurine dioxygenase